MVRRHAVRRTPMRGNRKATQRTVRLGLRQRCCVYVNEPLEILTAKAFIDEFPAISDSLVLPKCPLDCWTLFDTSVKVKLPKLPMSKTALQQLRLLCYLLL